MVTSYYSYASQGNIANVAVLAVALAYAACVLYFTQEGRQGVLDEEWRKDGFCIQNKDIPYWSSFDTCLYVDTLFCILIMGLYFSWKDMPGMARSSQLVPMVSLGTFAHGLAHAMLAAKFRNANPEEVEVASYRPSHLEWVIMAIIFWFPFLKVSMIHASNWQVAVLSCIVTFGNSKLTRKQYGFMYVQTIIAIATHCSQLALSRKEKECREYMTFVLSALPAALTSWNELLLCSAYFKYFGGHVLYDGSICFGVLFFYIDAYFYHKNGAQAEKVVKHE
jgi:hypothetical protein